MPRYDTVRDSWQPSEGDAPNSKRRSNSVHESPKKRIHVSDVENSRVASHYNEIPNTNQHDRQKSDIIGLRKFNNLIKGILIDEFSKPRDIVLDIGCGKGGDLLKWAKACIDGLIGVDIADVSITHAQDRFKQLKFKTFWTDFCVGDPFSQKLEDIVSPKAFPVDHVSCQFALHYAFSSEETARFVLSNISRVLRRNGKFIGTIPNSELFSEHLKNNETKWGNSLYSVKFDKPNPSGVFEPMFGQRYTFFLREAVDNVPEFVIPWEPFVKLASEYGLRLEMSSPFLPFFKDSIRDHDIRSVAMRQDIIRNDGSFRISDEQIEACKIYRVFCFVRE